MLEPDRTARITTALAFAAAVAACATTAVAQEESEVEDSRTITVSATGSVDAAPDRAVLTLAVETVAATAEEALSQNARRADAVIRTLTEAGIPREDIGTAAFGLNPEYARPGRGEPEGEPRIVGYRAYNTLRVVVDELDRAGEIIDAAAAAGSNRIGGPSFEIADPQALRLRALERAVDKARAEAEALAAALGVTLGDPLTVDSSFGETPPPMPVARFAMMEQADVGTPIEPGRMSVSATVRITWGLIAR